MTRKVVKQIHKATRRRLTAEENFGIAWEGLRGEIPVMQLCCKEGIQPSIHYRGSRLAVHLYGVRLQPSVGEESERAPVADIGSRLSQGARTGPHGPAGIWESLES